MDMTGLAIPRPTKRSKKPGAKPGGNKYKARATKDENRTAKRLSEATGVPFERVPMSGARKHVGLDGDVRTWPAVRDRYLRWLLELKNKEVQSAAGKKQVTFELDWLEQVTREADENGMLPALLYRYTGDTRVWTVVELGTFEELLRELREMYEATA